MEGILIVDKPSGITSFGVVARVRKLASIAVGKKIKVGHAGTLDPFATGLLILLVGGATKKAGDFLKLDKSYLATVRLGQVSTTADPEGELSDFTDKQPSLDQIRDALDQLKGEIHQTPPIFSAIKVNGRRAYDLARKGQDVQLSPRVVTVYDYEDLEYSYPNLTFKVSVSSGTYIRSLAVDIGNILGTGAYLKELRRISVGGYDIKSAAKLDSLTAENIQSALILIDKN